MDAFEEIALSAWQRTRTPLEEWWDRTAPGWDAEMPLEFPTFALVDRAGSPVACSACSRSDLWGMTTYGKWRCAGQHEPVWIGRGYIEQIIEVRPDEVVIRDDDGGPATAGLFG